jgi:hypothetical protein
MFLLSVTYPRAEPLPSLPAAVAEFAAAETEREVSRLPGANPCLHVSPYLQEYVRSSGVMEVVMVMLMIMGAAGGLWRDGEAEETKSDDS